MRARPQLDYANRVVLFDAGKESLKLKVPYLDRHT